MARTTPLLDKIKQPSDLGSMTPSQMRDLAVEIRGELLETVAANGGHLASNLGVVELTISLLRVFHEENDQIVWDTGHQAYVYKLLTGRHELFRSLRQHRGCCGFPLRQESDYDIFGTGHAGTAISAATGICVANEQLNLYGRTVAVVGDGALGCGISLEGLNNVIESTNRLIIILNDNKMSISPNVGALSRYLNKIISGRRYNRLKGVISRGVEKVPKVGRGLHRVISRIQESVKNLLIPGMFFEELGFRYIGPLNGHDLNELTSTLERLKPLDEQPLLIHVITEKGHGYEPAEKDPATFHGVGKFEPETGKIFKKTDPGNKAPSFGACFGNTLEKMLRENSRVTAITAGMCDGTGMKNIRNKFPKRFYDVGIAEEHAVVFAAGLAAQGMRPVVAIYASFMQRAFDYVFHDVALQNLPVIFCLDRAGAVPDGPTHHGIHDLGFWQSVPNITVMQPADPLELTEMLQSALKQEGPALIRYPKRDQNEDVYKNRERPKIKLGKAIFLREGKDVSLWCLGPETKLGLEAAEKLAENNIQADVVNVRFLKPFDRELLLEQAQSKLIVTIEDHTLTGGLASLVNAALCNQNQARIRNFGWPDEEIVPWGSIDDLRERFGLTPENIARQIQEELQPVFSSS